MCCCCCHHTSRLLSTFFVAFTFFFSRLSKLWCIFHRPYEYNQVFIANNSIKTISKIYTPNGNFPSIQQYWFVTDNFSIGMCGAETNNVHSAHSTSFMLYTRSMYAKEYRNNKMEKEEKEKRKYELNRSDASLCHQ